LLLLDLLGLGLALLVFLGLLILGIELGKKAKASCFC
jgi:hypothetical protein